MELTHPLTTIIVFLFTAAFPTLTLSALSPCKSKCGSLPIQYPLGTGPGCGSPRFQPFITCSAADQLLLTTHTGTYPVTSISYPASTLTIIPPLLSTCAAMHYSPNLGIDWSSPFQLASSLFLLLGCAAPSSSLTYKGTPLCDPANAHLCAALYTCPSVSSIGLSLFSPSNTCCVYSPANLGPHGDLDLQGLHCAAFSSVVALGDVPTDPSHWEYGVTLKFSAGGVDNYNLATACRACEQSSGICGYAPPRNYFICVCQSGVNTTSDCYGQKPLWNGHNPSRLSAGCWMLSLSFICSLWLFL